MKPISERYAVAVALCAILAAIVLMPAGSTADGTPTGGECGEDLVWKLDDGLRVLTIQGTGEMDDYRYGSAPWYGHRDTIREISFGMGCTQIGDYAFANLRCGTLSLPASLESIGECAFEKNDFTTLDLPYGLKTIEEGAFRGCALVTSISFSSDTVPFLGADSFMLDDGAEHAKGCNVYSALKEGFLDDAVGDMEFPPTHRIGHSLVAAVSDNDGLRFDVPVTGAYEKGDTLRLAPVLTSGYTFIGWSDGFENIERTVVFSDDVVYVALAAPEFVLSLYSDEASKTPLGTEMRYGGEAIPVNSLDLGEKAGSVLSGVKFQGRFYATDRTIEMPYGDASVTGVWTDAPAPASEEWKTAVIAFAVCATASVAVVTTYAHVRRTR